VIERLVVLGATGDLTARYLLPGLALAAVVAGAGLGAAARGRPPVAVAALAAVAVSAVLLGGELRRDGGRLARGATLAADLERTVRLAGGTERVRACGTPYTGRFRGPAVAWRLGVEKRAVDFAPRRPGVVFRSRLRTGDPIEPALPRGFRRLASSDEWEIWARCAPSPNAS
jgi:hypothetical protein